MELQAQRISKSAILQLEGTIQEVFPLFGPLREKDWAYDWDPEILYSLSPLVEEGMIFRTKASDSIDQYYSWIITRFDPSDHLIVYTVTAADRIWFISVQCYTAKAGTEARVSYTYTGLTSESSARNREALEKMFAHDLKDWEKAINYYLRYGKPLKPDDAEFSHQVVGPDNETFIDSEP